MPFHPTTKIVSPIKIVKSMDKNSSSNKRALSVSPPQSPTIANINKLKKFVTPNRFSALTPHEPESIVVDDNVTNEPLDLQNQAQTHTTNNTPRVILLTPIFVEGVVDFLQLINSFIHEIGLDNFT